MKKERLTKKETVKLLLDLFASTPGQAYNAKDIFRLLGAKTHPAKMLVLDVLTELIADDYISNDHGT